MRAPLDSTIGEEFENTRLPLGYFHGGKLPEPGRFWASRARPCRCARQLRFAPTRDLFGSGRHPAEPPRGTSFWFWAGATRPAGSAGFECVFGLDSLVYSKIGHTHTHTHTHTQTNKTLSIFPPALAPTRPGLPCVYPRHRPDPRICCTATEHRPAPGHGLRSAAPPIKTAKQQLKQRQSQRRQ